MRARGERGASLSSVALASGTADSPPRPNKRAIYTNQGRAKRCGLSSPLYSDLIRTLSFHSKAEICGIMGACSTDETKVQG